VEPAGENIRLLPSLIDDSEELPKPIVSYDEEHPANFQSSGEINCDGQSVFIGAELFDALRRLRLRDRQRTIRIDALCINQQEINKQNVQFRI